ncbi:MAG TPA: DUF1549 domain-containing protein, partial [Gemmataceae bacterium]|nr:DUF1549 domain-containing protein [Gemmataceae bacterium]
MGLLFASLTRTAPPFDSKSPANKPVEPDHAAKMAKGLEIFKTHVRPVLEKRCLKCHGGKSVESELNLADRQGLLRGGNSGPAILVGNAKESLLYKLINHAKDPAMPHNSPKLADETIRHIAAWIDNGAPYDEALVAGKNKEPAWTRKVVSEDARQFWSFQPLQPSNPPAVKNNAWCRTPIDSFILAKMAAAGIQPNRAADKRQLLRRIYFDLVGFPPPPEEVDAFLKDTSPNAYEKWIDRLLASPQYGERWGRHWLDLARFAESHGFEHDYDRPAAYHYRDFVIKALNEDLPYDTFVKWQLAGDEFEPENNLALLATGFLAAGVHSTQITIKEVARHRYDEMDDMSATIGTAMLGLTIGCARCHDHKFDPIPQADYYRLLSTFTATVRSEIDINFEAAQYQKDKAAFDREHAPYEEALKQFEREKLPQHLAEWEDRQASAENSFPWIILDCIGFRSEGAATFTKQDDGSLLVSGKNPPFDTYTLVAQTDLAKVGITGIRLEALADPSLIKGGPGRALNGNFALSDLRVTVAPADAKDKPVPARLRNPRATYEQKGLPVAAAIDNDEKSAWAIDPQIGKNHAAIFEFEKAIACQGPVILTFTLKFKNNTGHSIGRPRLALTTQKGLVDLHGLAIYQPLLPILAMPRQQRSPEQTAMLSNWYRTIDPAWQNLNLAAQNHRNKAPKPNLVKALIS